MAAACRNAGGPLRRLRSVPGASKGYILAFASTACVALNFVTAKYAMLAFAPHVFVVVWFAAAACYAFVYLALRAQPTPWHQIGSHLRPFAGVTLAATASALADFWGLHLTDPTVAAFVSRTYIPASILLGVGFLRERPTRLEVGGILLCLLGLFIVVSATGTVNELAGPGLLLVGAVLYALSNMFAREAAAHVDPTLLTGVRGAGIAVIVGIGATAAGRLHMPLAPAHLAVLLVGAFFGPFLAHVLLYRALAYLELSQAGAVQASQPLFAAIYAAIFLGAVPGLRQILGGLVIIAGLLTIVRGGRHKMH